MSAPQEQYFALLTGANSGLGLGLCIRFTTEFLHSRPSNHTLTLIFTTRSAQKSSATATYITQHLTSLENSLHQKEQKVSLSFRERIKLAPENVDLTDILSVLALSEKLKKKYPKIDWVFLNAGMATIRDGGVNWLRATYKCCTDLVSAVTYPDFKLQQIGAVSPQKCLPSGVDKEKREEDKLGPLGTAFAANVFGHYILVHEIMALLHSGGVTPAEKSRVIWTSSIEAYAYSFDISDIECLKGGHSYESSKRLTDILILSYNSSKSSSLYTDFFTSESAESEHGQSTESNTSSDDRPLFLLSHPGVCGTSIFPLHPILGYLMLLAFYLARIILNSHWHTISTYRGNAATCYLSFASQEELEAVSAEKFKWGSGASRFGKEEVRKTEVVGWMEDGESVRERLICERMDLGGKVRKEYGSEVVLGETRDEFLEVGMKAWMEMERLRKGWLTRAKFFAQAENNMN